MYGREKIFKKSWTYYYKFSMEEMKKFREVNINFHIFFFSIKFQYNIRLNFIF